MENAMPAVRRVTTPSVYLDWRSHSESGNERRIVRAGGRAVMTAAGSVRESWTKGRDVECLGTGLEAGVRRSLRWAAGAVGGVKSRHRRLLGRGMNV